MNKASYKGVIKVMISVQLCGEKIHIDIVINNKLC